MRFTSSCLACLFLFQATAWAIVIENEKKQRIAGYLESEDAKKIVMRAKTPDGKKGPRIVLDKTKVKVIHKIDVGRLEKLNKETAKAYFDYARELAKRTDDPEAMELAVRLYVIAAHLDTVNLGQQSLLGLSALAEQPADTRKFLALAYLLDPKSDPKMLKEDKKPGIASAQEFKAPAKPLVRFQKALEQYRASDAATVVKAKSIADEKGVPEYFSKTGLDKSNFLQACDDRKCPKCKATGTVTCPTCNGKGVVADPMNPFGGFRPCTACIKGKQKCSTCGGVGLGALPEDYLRNVLRAEIWALDQIVTMEPIAKKTPGSWSHALSNQQRKVPNLTLKTITPYDPRECLYRDGKWMAP